MEWLNIPGIVTTVAGAFVIYVASQVRSKIASLSSQHEELIGMQKRFVVLEKDYSDMQRSHEALVESQRTQIKNTIVHIYETSRERGFIYATELEVANRMADCYFKLGGNSYISAIMKHLNNDFEVLGEIPYE